MLQMNGYGTVSNGQMKIYDEETTLYKGLIFNEGSPQICAQPYLQALAEGDIANHVTWSEIGYNGALVANTEADLWSGSGTYTFPVAAAGMEVLSSNNTDDIGTEIFSGTSSGGSLTTLVDATKDFTGGTPVAAGDCVVLSKAGATPEWGCVTAVTNATTLAISGGFSSGGSGAIRSYSIIDKSAKAGAQCVKIDYLDANYIEKSEIVFLNGTTVVNTVNTDLYRINRFTIIVTGSNAKPTGNISIRNIADTPVYGYITAGYTRERRIMYTVPSGKTLYVTSGTFGYGYTHNSTHFCRIYTRANIDSTINRLTGNIFYPYSEFICANNTIVRMFECPRKLPEKTDIKVSAIADYAGICTVALRGWLE